MAKLGRRELVSRKKSRVTSPRILKCLGSAAMILSSFWRKEAIIESFEIIFQVQFSLSRPCLSS
jgi:hypothetical protein